MSKGYSIWQWKVYSKQNQFKWTKPKLRPRVKVLLILQCDLIWCYILILHSCTETVYQNTPSQWSHIKTFPVQIIEGKINGYVTLRLQMYCNTSIILRHRGTSTWTLLVSGILLTKGLHWQSEAASQEVPASHILSASRLNVGRSH